MNTPERVYLNLCELFIDSLFLKKHGYIYFVWKKGKKHIQSLKYQPRGDQYQIKETLTLNLKVYVKGFTPLQRSTRLFLLDTEGREIDRISLRVDQWTSQFRNMEVPVGGGKVILRGRRKQIMELQNFRKVKSEIQESSQEQQNYDKMSRYSTRQQKTEYYHGQQVNILHQEMDKTRRDLEDALYLNNKLKNDRGVLISQIKDLQFEHSEVLKRVGGEINRLKAHFQQKIEIRESVYQEEIQQLVLYFNDQFQINKNLLEKMTDHNIMYEKELKLNKEKSAKEKKEAQETSQKLLEQQDRIYRDTVKKHSNERQKMTNHIDELEHQIDEKTQKIVQLSKRLGQANQNIREMQITIKENFEGYKKNVEEKQNIIMELDATIEELRAKCEMQEKDLEVRAHTVQILQKQLKQSGEMIQSLRNELNEETKKCMHLDSDKFRVECEVQKIKTELEQKKNELEFLENLLQDQKIQAQRRQQEYDMQLRRMQEIYVQKNQIISQQVVKAHGTIRDLQKDNYDQIMKQQHMQQDLSVRDMRIEVLSAEVERLNTYKDSLQEANQSFMKDISDNLKSLAELQDKLIKQNAINIRLSNELEINEARLNEEMKKLHENYNQMIAENGNVYAEQIQMLRRQIKVESEDYDKYRHQYEILANEHAQAIQNYEERISEEKQIYLKALEQKNLALKEQGQIIRQLKGQFTAQNAYIGELESDIEQYKTRIEQLQREIQGVISGHIQRVANVAKIKERSPVSSKGHIKIGSSQQIPHKNKVVLQQSDAQTSYRLIQDYVKQKASKMAESGQYFDSKNGRGITAERAKEMMQSEVFEQINKEKLISEMKETPKRLRESYNASNKFIQHNKEYLKNSSLSSQIMGRMKESMQKIRDHMRQLNQDEEIDIDKLQLIQKNMVALQREFILKEGQLKQRQDDFIIREKQYIDTIQKLQDELKMNDERIQYLQGQLEKLKKHRQDRILQVEDRSRSASIQGQQPSIQYLRKRTPDASGVYQEIPPVKKQNYGLQVDINVGDSLPPHFNYKFSTVLGNDVKQYQQEYKNQNNGSLQKLQEKLMESQIQKNRIKAEMEMKFSFAQNRAEQAQRKEKQNIAEKKLLQEKLERQRKQLRNQLDEEMEKFHKYKAEKQKILDDQEQQLRKLRAKVSEFQDRKKTSGPDFFTQYQNDMQESNRKLMAMSRSLNQEKLEKENLQDELRMLKKKLQETTRVSHDIQQKALLLQKRLDQNKRSETKLKREIQDKEEQLSKVGYEVKALRDEIQRLNTVNSQLTMEKKLACDEISQLNDQIGKKEVQIQKIGKDIEKYRMKMQRNEDQITQKKSELKKEIERLEMVSVRGQKRISQLQEELRITRNRLEASEKEKKKSLEQKTQNYGDKLNLYVDEISNIKQMLSDNQNEMSRLKIQNSQFFQQNQIMKSSFEKLQMKYQQAMENQEMLLNDVAKLKQQLSRSRDQVQSYQFQIEKLDHSCESLRKEIEEQRIVSRKKNEKLQLYEETSQKYLYELKSLKIKMNENHVDAEALNKLTERFHAQEQRATELDYKLGSLVSDFEYYKKKYTVTQNDYQQALEELRIHCKHQLESQMENLTNSLNEKHSNRMKQLEEEILEMFNQNAKMRGQLHKAKDQNGEMKLSVYELSLAQQKIEQLKRSNDSLSAHLLNAKQSLISQQEKGKRLDQALRTSQSKNQKYLSEIQLLKLKNQEIYQRNRLLQDTVKELQELEQKNYDRINSLTVEKEISVENLKSDIQVLNNKLLAAELQSNRLKQSEASMTEAYTSKIKKLEKKMTEMSEAMQQHEAQLQNNFNIEYNNSQGALMRCNEQIMQKSNKISELTLALQQSQIETEELGKELANARFKANQEIEIWSDEMNKLRHKLKETEEAYNNNMRQLEEELGSMSKELTMAKLNKNSLTGSRFGVGSDVQERFARRNQEKIKMKDKKIEELKTTVYTLEQSIMKLKKKEASESLSTQLQRLKAQYNELNRQLKVVSESKQTESSRLNEQVRQLKKQIIEVKERQEHLTLETEQKDLQIDSLSCQLKTTKELYQEMQRELNKRKALLSQKMADKEAEARLEQSLQKNIENQLVIEELTKNLEISRSELKKKNIQLRKLQQNIKKLEQAENQMKNQKYRNSTDLTQLKRQIKDREAIIDNLKSQISKINTQLTQNSTEIFELRNDKQILKQKNDQMQKTIEEQIGKINQSMLSIRQFYQLKEKCNQTYGMSLQECINGVPWQIAIREKDGKIEELTEQLEEMRFMQERNILDYEQLKKEHYEMEIRMEDNSFLNDQLDTLRRICDKLQEEKQEAVFKEEAVRVQLQSVLDSDGKELKNRVREILRKGYP